MGKSFWETSCSILGNFYRFQPFIFFGKTFRPLCHLYIHLNPFTSINKNIYIYFYDFLCSFISIDIYVSSEKSRPLLPWNLSNTHFHGWDSISITPIHQSAPQRSPDGDLGPTNLSLPMEFWRQKRCAKLGIPSITPLVP